MSELRTFGKRRKSHEAIRGEYGKHSSVCICLTAGNSQTEITCVPVRCLGVKVYHSFTDLLFIFRNISYVCVCVFFFLSWMWNYLLTVRFGGICSNITTRQMLKIVSLVLMESDFDIQAFLLGAASFWIRNEKPRFFACEHIVKMHLLWFSPKLSKILTFSFIFYLHSGFWDRLGTKFLRVQFSYSNLSHCFYLTPMWR